MARRPAGRRTPPARLTGRTARERAHYSPRRAGPATRAGLATIAADHDALLVNPLLDDGFLAALTAMAGRRRRATRIELLGEIAGTALPAEVVAPRPKARFLEVFLRDPTRQFVRSWDGGGVDEDLVDAAALRRLWARWPIPAGTATLVQDLWLRADSPPEGNGAGAEQGPPPRTGNGPGTSFPVETAGRH